MNKNKYTIGDNVWFAWFKYQFNFVCSSVQQVIYNPKTKKYRYVVSFPSELSTIIIKEQDELFTSMESLEAWFSEKEKEEQERQLEGQTSIEH